MKRTLWIAGAALALAAMLPGLARAQVGKGLSGPHYNLNVIGVPKDKSADMTDSNRHTVFVPLDTSGRLDGNVKIYFVAGDEFRVLDGNATDQDGATIEVPHGDPGTVCYDVFAVGLGKPGGNAYVDANVIFDETDHQALLSLDQVSFHVSRGGGKPHRQNISNVFRVSGCIDLNDTGVCDAGDLDFNNEWVFNVDQLLSYWWDYDNQGLKLMQIRFYDCSLGNATASSDVARIRADGGISLRPMGSAGARQQIAYRLAEGARVRLSVFSVSGRLVATVVDGFQGPGEHTAAWDAAGQPNGIYFYRLQAGKETAATKVRVMR